MNIEIFKELISANVTFDEYSIFKVEIRNIVQTAKETVRPQRVRPAKAEMPAKSSRRP